LGLQVEDKASWREGDLPVGGPARAWSPIREAEAQIQEAVRKEWSGALGWTDTGSQSCPCWLSPTLCAGQLTPDH
jgi:hypothetical protein